jgi:tripartite ATP-independent transporter DctM subunit
MIDLSAEVVTLIMLVGLIFLVMLGYPLAFGIGGIALGVGLMLFGSQITGDIFHSRMWSIIFNYGLLAAPGFIFMGGMLERSGIAEKLYDAMYLWFGGFRGGLAITTILIGTILAACIGVIAASVVMLTLIALPAMAKRSYSKSLATGSICAGGTLGILIPPSIMLIIYGPMAEISVGKLFFAAFPPGILLSILYCVYIAVYCLIKPEAGPALPLADRRVPFGKKIRMLIVSLVPPVILVLAVLGSIFTGVAAPTEAAGVGAFVSAILVICYRKFSFRILKEVLIQVIRLSGMILIIAAAASFFIGVFMRAGGGQVVTDFILAIPGGKWGAFALIMIICFILGMFIDWMGIVLIMVPIVTPIGDALGFDPLWFAMMICINLQMSFMSPPFALAIFFLKGTSPKELGISTGDIYRGVIPFILIVVVTIVLCIIFPEIITWLPGQMIK